MARSQDLSAGDNSANSQAGRDSLQAGRDVIHAGGNVYQVGITYDQARDIALDVFEANFLRMVGLAADIVRERVEIFTRDYLDKLLAVSPPALSGVQDPDTLKSIYVAQETFARSGEDDVEKVLVDLLVDRTKQQDRELKTIVLNDAIAALPRLSRRQRKLIAIVFVLKYTRPERIIPLPDFYAGLSAGLAPFIDDLPDRRADYIHIQSTGTGLVSTFERSLGQIFRDSSIGFFTNGFRVNDVPEGLRRYIRDSQVFVRSIRDSSKIQINVVTSADANKLALAKKLDLNEIVQLINRSPMNDRAIQYDLETRVPEMTKVFELWNRPGSVIKNFELTAVGMAIGHSYWRQLVGSESTPLDAWLLFR